MFAKSLNGHYNLPSKETLKTNVIIPMYEETKQAIKKLLAPATDVALTCDNWTTLEGGTRSYLTVTCHFISEDFVLHDFVLITEKMQVSNTAGNLLEALEDIIEFWELK